MVGLITPIFILHPQKKVVFFFISVSNFLSQKITLFLGTLSDTKKRRRGDVTVLSVLDRPVLFLRYSERPNLLDLNYAVDRRNGFCVSKELLGTR